MHALLFHYAGMILAYGPPLLCRHKRSEAKRALFFTAHSVFRDVVTAAINNYLSRPRSFIARIILIDIRDAVRARRGPPRREGRNALQPGKADPPRSQGMISPHRFTL